MSIIETIRTTWGITQSEMAEMAGVKQPSVWRWERGIEVPLSAARQLKASAVNKNLEWKDEWFLPDVEKYASSNEADR